MQHFQAVMPSSAFSAFLRSWFVTGSIIGNRSLYGCLGDHSFVSAVLEFYSREWTFYVLYCFCEFVSYQAILSANIVSSLGPHPLFLFLLFGLASLCPQHPVLGCPSTLFHSPGVPHSFLFCHLSVSLLISLSFLSPWFCFFLTSFFCLHMKVIVCFLFMWDNLVSPWFELSLIW